MKRKFTFLFTSLFCVFTSSVIAQPINEGFDNITTLVPGGWFMQNNSVPVGPIGWFQGNDASFPAFSGASTSYIAANFNNTTGANTISNWLVTPNRTFKNGDVITFYTRKSGGIDEWPDRLEVRLSTNGTSTNVGTGSAAVGDFTTVLLTINPALVSGGYPQVWTQYTITISGLTAPTSGRIAFRYFVTNGGPSGLNSDYIGIDNFVYTPYVCPALVITTPSLPNGQAGIFYSQSLAQTGALGTPTYTIASGALPTGLTLSAAGVISGTPTALGTFNFDITVSDASGCSGTQPYSITIVCAPNTTTLTGLPSLCTNGSLHTLTGGSPAGGVYSGTGVTGGIFDPSVGTQIITYTYTDPYTCVYDANAVLTVNSAPSVSHGTVAVACSNDTPITLTGGVPAGGNYSGTGITGSSFNPSVGSQNITYTYIDGNGCSDQTSFTITVNTSPSVSLSLSTTTICNNVNPIPLSGGTPAGGNYSGTGVSANEFNPGVAGVGVHSITYTFVDGNNCSSSASGNLTVNNCASIDEVESSQALTVYPNPSNGQYQIKVQLGNEKIFDIVVYDLQGKILKSEKVQINEKNEFSLDIQDFDNGIYYIKIVYNNEEIIQKLVKN